MSSMLMRRRLRINVAGGDLWMSKKKKNNNNNNNNIYNNYINNLIRNCLRCKIALCYLFYLLLMDPLSHGISSGPTDSDSSGAPERSDTAVKCSLLIQALFHLGPKNAFNNISYSTCNCSWESGSSSSSSSTRIGLETQKEPKRETETARESALVHLVQVNCTVMNSMQGKRDKSGLIAFEAATNQFVVWNSTFGGAVIWSSAPKDPLASIERAKKCPNNNSMRPMLEPIQQMLDNSTTATIIVLPLTDQVEHLSMNCRQDEENLEQSFGSRQSRLGREQQHQQQYQQQKQQQQQRGVIIGPVQTKQPYPLVHGYVMVRVLEPLYDDVQMPIICSDDDMSSTKANSFECFLIHQQQQQQQQQQLQQQQQSKRPRPTQFNGHRYDHDDHDFSISHVIIVPTCEREQVQFGSNSDCLYLQQFCNNCSPIQVGIDDKLAIQLLARSDGAWRGQAREMAAHHRSEASNQRDTKPKFQDRYQALQQLLIRDEHIDKKRDTKRVQAKCQLVHVQYVKCLISEHNHRLKYDGHDTARPRGRFSLTCTRSELPSSCLSPGLALEFQFELGLELVQVATATSHKHGKNSGSSLRNAPNNNLVDEFANHNSSDVVIKTKTRSTRTNATSHRSSWSYSHRYSHSIASNAQRTGIRSSTSTSASTDDALGSGGGTAAAATTPNTINIVGCSVVEIKARMVELLRVIVVLGKTYYCSWRRATKCSCVAHSRQDQLTRPHSRSWSRSRSRSRSRIRIREVSKRQTTIATPATNHANFLLGLDPSKKDVHSYDATEASSSNHDTAAVAVLLAPYDSSSHSLGETTKTITNETNRRRRRTISSGSKVSKSRVVRQQLKLDHHLLAPVQPVRPDSPSFIKQHSQNRFTPVIAHTINNVFKQTHSRSKISMTRWHNQNQRKLVKQTSFIIEHKNYLFNRNTPKNGNHIIKRSVSSEQKSLDKKNERLYIIKSASDLDKSGNDKFQEAYNKSNLLDNHLKSKSQIANTFNIAIPPTTRPNNSSHPVEVISSQNHHHYQQQQQQQQQQQHHLHHHQPEIMSNDELLELLAQYHVHKHELEQKLIRYLKVGFSLVSGWPARQTNSSASASASKSTTASNSSDKSNSTTQQSGQVISIKTDSDKSSNFSVTSQSNLPLRQHIKLTQSPIFSNQLIKPSQSISLSRNNTSTSINNQSILTSEASFLQHFLVKHPNLWSALKMKLGADDESLLRWLKSKQDQYSTLKNITIELIAEAPKRNINVCPDGPKIWILGSINSESQRTVSDIFYCYTHDQWIKKLWFDWRPSPYHYPLLALNMLIFLFGATGNIFVCLSVYRNHQLRNVTNYHIVNLAVADLLVIIICLPATSIWDVSLTWFFGTIPCKLIMYLQDVSISVSVLTLAAISIDRYYAICYPLRFKSSLNQAKRVICLIWLFSFTIMAPDLMYLAATQSRELSEAGLDTVLYSDCNYTWSEQSSLLFQYVKTILLYLVPFVFMFVAHFRIMRTLRQSSQINEFKFQTQKSCDSRNSSEIQDETRRSSLIVNQAPLDLTASVQSVECGTLTKSVAKTMALARPEPIPKLNLTRAPDKDNEQIESNDRPNMRLEVIGSEQAKSSRGHLLSSFRNGNIQKRNSIACIQPSPEVRARNSLSFTMNNKSQLESRRKAAQMLMAIVIFFGVCNLPVHLMNFLRHFIEDLPQNDFTLTISMVAHSLCHLNSAINPIIYNYMNNIFRAEFKRSLSCILCRNQRNSVILRKKPVRQKQEQQQQLATHRMSTPSGQVTSLSLQYPVTVKTKLRRDLCLEIKTSGSGGELDNVGGNSKLTS